MSINELKHTYLKHKQQHLPLNINCGYLRRIGKSLLLTQLIEEYLETKPMTIIVNLIVKNSTMKSHYHRNYRFSSSNRL